MVDSLGNPINVGDIVVQGSGDWGLYFYRVDKDPESTKTLHVWDVQHDFKRHLSKKPDYYINLTVMFGERYAEEEIELMIKRNEDA